MDLFDQQVIPVNLSPELGTSNIVFWPNWLCDSEADQLLSRAIEQTDWRQDNIRIAGKIIPVPRLQNWFGDPATSYTYSGIRLQAVSFPDWMEQLRLSVEGQTGQRFNRAWLTIIAMAATVLTGMRMMKKSWVRRQLLPLSAWGLSGCFSCATISVGRSCPSAYPMGRCY
jgi:hypothetical protein